MTFMRAPFRRKTAVFKQLLTLAVVLPSLAMASAAFAADVDRAPTINSSKDFGLYVWRAAGDQNEWHVRLAGGNGTIAFDGNFQTNGSISNLRTVEISGPDSANLSGNDTLNIDFSAFSGDVDGVRFKLNGNDLCLRSNTTSVAVFLGQNKIPRQTPVDLTDSGACKQTPILQKGMIVADTGNNSYEVRLISTNANESFTGTIQSTADLRWFSRIDLESTDSVTKPNAKTLNVDLAAWPGGIDGTNVGVVAGSGLCVRATGGDYSQIVVVDANGNASLRSSPVDVKNNGACSGSSGGSQPPPPPPPSAGNRRYNNGHYVALLRGLDSQSIMASEIKPGVVGFLKRYTWRELEPTQGNYKLEEIASDLQFARSQGMQLVVMIEDKTFQNENPMPNYLAKFPNRPGGFTGGRWQNQYVNRFNALTAEIGRRFNSNPALEGIAIQESAIGINDNILNANGYSAKKYSDALVNIITTGLNNIPNARFFWYMNFLEGGMDELEVITKKLEGTGAIIGGPDIMPDEWPLQRWAYPLYRKYADKISFFGQVEPICYRHEKKDPNAKTKYWTMPELYNYGKNNLKVDYIFWVRWPKPQGADYYDFSDARPVIQNNIDFNN